MKWYKILIHSIFLSALVGALVFYIAAVVIAPTAYPWWAHMTMSLAWLFISAIEVTWLVIELEEGKR